jgi:hypothetical protein
MYEVVSKTCEVHDWYGGLTDYENDSSGWTHERKVSESCKTKTDIRSKYDDRSWKQTDGQEENIAAKHKIRLTNKQVVCMTSSQVYPVPVRPMLKL